jgi:hypothetical protein
MCSGSEVTDGVGRTIGEELEVSESFLSAGGGRGGIFGVDSVLSELFMGWELEPICGFV